MDKLKYRTCELLCQFGYKLAAILVAPAGLQTEPGGGTMGAPATAREVFSPIKLYLNYTSVPYLNLFTQISKGDILLE
jgi:hypothetical protein